MKGTNQSWDELADKVGAVGMAAGHGDGRATDRVIRMNSNMLSNVNN